MSQNEHLQNELNQEISWLDSPFTVSINCPQCGQWLWDEDEQDFLKTCPACNWEAPQVEELPEHLQAAIGFMQLVAQKVESGVALTPNEMQLLAQAGTYAVMAG